MSDDKTPVINPPVSPTGTPVIPVKYTPILMAIPVVLAAIGNLLPPYTLAGKWLPTLAVTLASIFGGASAGLRK